MARVNFKSVRTKEQLLKKLDEVGWKAPKLTRIKEDKARMD